MAVQATAVWRVRPSGVNTNGGGYDPGISGAATDYSQQNAAQATGTLGTSTASTTFTDAGGVFTAAMVGNALWIASGAGFTVGPYFITAFTNSTTITLDRASGTGTVAHWAIGGGWADPWTNTTSALAYVVPGNTIFILGSGTPNPAAYTYDYTSPGLFSPAPGSIAAGLISYNNDPGTPGYKAPPDTTGGMPTIKSADIIWNNQGYLAFRGLWLVSSGVTNPTLGLIRYASSTTGFVFGCVYDQFGNDRCFVSGGNTAIVGCECFSSVGAAGTQSVLSPGNIGFLIDGCNIHDTVGPPIVPNTNASGTISNNIIAKCTGNAIELQVSGTVFIISVFNNTIDGNTGSGIVVDTTSALISPMVIFNNIISNHTGGGKFGLSIGSGTAAVNDVAKVMVDYNVFYNNTTNYNAISAGPHDTALGSDPYVGQSTQNFTLA